MTFCKNLSFLLSNKQANNIRHPPHFTLNTKTLHLKHRKQPVNYFWCHLVLFKFCRSFLQIVKDPISFVGDPIRFLKRPIFFLQETPICFVKDPISFAGDPICFAGDRNLGKNGRNWIEMGGKNEFLPLKHPLNWLFLFYVADLNSHNL